MTHISLIEIQRLYFFFDLFTEEIKTVLQIVAVILCDTGIALLAYMDGITGSPTLSGVVLAAAAAAGSAVYKVSLVLFLLKTHNKIKLLLLKNFFKAF